MTQYRGTGKHPTVRRVQSGGAGLVVSASDARLHFGCEFLAVYVEMVVDTSCCDFSPPICSASMNSSSSFVPMVLMALMCVSPFGRQ